MSELTNPEIRLVEQYVGVLDYLSRCAQAIDTDDWWYLLIKTAELQRRVAWLHGGADELWQAIDRQRRLPRRGAIAAAVAWHGRHYRAGRLLHPAEPRGRR
jgi:hypothetical protein